MNDQKLQNQRHSLAHLLAAAVLELYPDAKRTIGPAVDNGFYYDFDFPTPVTDKDLPKIEKKMRELLPRWTKFERTVANRQEALAKFPDNQYKQELIEEFTSSSPLPEGEGKGEGSSTVTFYTCGGFEDLCRGGHAENLSTIDPDSFKLDRIAGAYWRGDEKNKMLTRIYGLAFASKEELEKYETQILEAKKRDHKILGPQLDLFVFSDLVGAGLPLWTPKGTLMRNLLDDFVWSLRKQAGYVKVEIPHITKKELYETSGHWSKFSEELFRITTREGHEFAMKPMNCPHHTQIFARKMWSYKELPQRYASTTMCYRDEQTGELTGITRARAFTQDDAHVFCAFQQAKAELAKIWDIVQTFYQAFGFSLRVRLSLHDPKQMEKYLGDHEIWPKAEEILRELATEMQANTFDGIGEAAFYGPKLDFMAKDAIGREHQLATIQLDLNMANRFKLEYIASDGSKQTPVMIHAAIMGSIERFMGVLIEHFAGAFPLWLSPVQVSVLPISDKHIEYANSVIEKLMAVDEGLRIDLDDRSESIGKKIREATNQKVPYMLIMGDKEVESQAVAVRTRAGEDLGSMSIDDLASKLKQEISTKA